VSQTRLPGWSGSGSGPMKQLTAVLEAAMSHRGWSMAKCSEASCVPIEILEQMFEGSVLITPPRLRGLLRLLDESHDTVDLVDHEAGLLISSGIIKVWTPKYVYIPRQLLPYSDSQKELRRAIAYVVEESRIPKVRLAKMSGIARSQLYHLIDVNCERKIRDKRLILELMRVCGLGEHGVWNIDVACNKLAQASDVKESVHESASLLHVAGEAVQDLAMRDEVVTDELWERLEPLLPVRPRRFRNPGRKPADDRAALEGILYVIRTGIGWHSLPTALFGASGTTCWRRLTEWHEAGIWQQLHERLIAELRAAGLLDLAASLLDWASPVDRRKLASNTA
jgi:transposase